MNFNSATKQLGMDAHTRLYLYKVDSFLLINTMPAKLTYMYWVIQAQKTDIFEY